MIRNRLSARLAITLSLFSHAALAAFALHRAAPSARAAQPSAVLETTFEVEAPELVPSDLAPPATTGSPAPIVRAAGPRAIAPMIAAVPAAAVASAPVTAAVASAAPASPVANAVPPSFVLLAPPVLGLASHRLSSATGSGSRLGGAGSGERAVGLSEPSREDAVDTPARLLGGAPPPYPAAARSAGVQADVPIEIVVDERGAVQSARSLAHVGYGLDEAALQAVRFYRFRPAMRAGKGVAIRMRWLMRFQLG